MADNVFWPLRTICDTRAVNYLRDIQYRDGRNLSARLELHERFSTNRYGWHRWLFDQLMIPAGARVLELGCGSATMWGKNRDRIDPTWDVTLSDFSPRMVEATRRALEDINGRFHFACIDAQAIPYADARFDVVIANHMLYHVPDRERAFGEIQRVLRPDGTLYAATNGHAHLREFDELAAAVGYDHEMILAAIEFGLETGLAQLQRFFGDVRVARYEDNLVVTQAEPLMAYIASMSTAAALDEAAMARVRAHIESTLATHGAYRITKDAGLFTARRT